MKVERTNAKSEKPSPTRRSLRIASAALAVVARGWRRSSRKPSRRDQERSRCEARSTRFFATLASRRSASLEFLNGTIRRVSSCSSSVAKPVLPPSGPRNRGCSTASSISDIVDPADSPICEVPDVSIRLSHISRSRSLRSNQKSLDSDEVAAYSEHHRCHRFLTKFNIGRHNLIRPPALRCATHYRAILSLLRSSHRVAPFFLIASFVQRKHRAMKRATHGISYHRRISSPKRPSPQTKLSRPTKVWQLLNALFVASKP